MTLLYRVVYLNKIKTSSSNIILNGKVIIVDGIVVLKGKFRSRSGLSINVNGGCLKIGNRVFFNNDVSLNCRSNIEIGNNVMIGEGVKFFDHDHVFPMAEDNTESYVKKPITVGSNVWIGANAIILKGVVIGDNVCIAAGSIVSKSIESNTVFIQKRQC
ncbi:acyltransferase [Vibrio fluvialis]|uniref:acyltransferase n=1 Tax=Vibrio fluvialis TaxID=676 RepID=UPI001F330876|nr:acyltransferase [Vibrio fluvialis]MCE7650703.1 acyltransferase [Vibrio fluvialis]